MTDTTWAAKVLEGVERYTPPYTNGNWIKEDDALAAIAKLGAGDDMVERLLENDREIFLPLLGEAAAHIVALTAQNREMALDVLASSGQAQEAYAAQLAAEAERDALRERVARLEGALHNCVGMLDQLVAESGRGIEWDQEDPFRMGEWFEPDDIKQLAQARAALTDGGKDG